VPSGKLLVSKPGPSVAVQTVALVEDQVSVVVPLSLTVVGLAVRVTVGLGICTVTLALAVAVPPGPVQETVKVVLVVKAVVASEPPVVLPVSKPRLLAPAVQEVAPVDDQVNVVVPPLVTVFGSAVRVAFTPIGLTVTSRLSLTTLEPVQTMVKIYVGPPV
jgi:hypothetical protein